LRFLSKKKNNKMIKLNTDLLHEFFLFLDKNTLYKCTLVSKEWSNISTPLLWRNYFYDKEKPNHYTINKNKVKNTFEKNILISRKFIFKI
jgi:hypothetical protein